MLMLPQGYIFPERSQMRSGRGRSGFTLVEVLLALGLFAIGSSALIALFLRNLYSAKLAREEVVLALISKDVATKNQLAAFTANSSIPGRAFTYQNGAGITDDFAIPAPPEGTSIADIRNGTNKQWLIGHPNAPHESIRQYNAVAAEFITWDVTKKRWLVDTGGYTGKYPGQDGTDRAKAAKKRIWESILMYKGFKFTLVRVTPHEFENYQFTDWDGYGKITEENIGVDLNQDGTIDDFVYTFPAPRGRRGERPEPGQPYPSHGVYYDSTGMRFYYKRLRLTVGWDLTNRKIITSGKWEQFIFPVYNPDLNKH